MTIKHINEYFNNGKGIPQGKPGRPRKRGERSELGYLTERHFRQYGATGNLIYFLSEGTGLIKIGVTSNLTKRSRDIQVSCPREIRVEAAITADDWDQALLIERFLHKTLKSHGSHIRGEWFSLSSRDIRKACTIVLREFGAKAEFIAA